MAGLDPAEKANARVDVREENGTQVFGLFGELDLSNVQDVRATVETALTSGTKQVAFEMSGLEFMDSSGIALLVFVARKVGDVELRQPTAIVRRLIELTGLAGMLRIVR